MLAMWVKVRVKSEERVRFLRRSRRMPWAPNGMSQAACASTFCATSKTPTSTTSLKFTGTKPRWKRTGQPHTMRYGGRPQTLWTGRPRRRVAIPYFLLPSSPGKNANSLGKASAEEALMRPQRAGSAGVCDCEAETNREEFTMTSVLAEKMPRRHTATDRRGGGGVSRAGAGMAVAGRGGADRTHLPI